MVRYLYAGTPGDYLSKDGRPVPGETIIVSTAGTDATVITDITTGTVGTVAAGVVTADSWGQFSFRGPDEYTGDLYVRAQDGGPWLRAPGAPGAGTGWDLRGAGSPEGVVTAGVGSYYTDTAATTGAIRWVKATGTGTTGWRVVYGDTGWRDITALLAAGVANVTATYARMRRVGDLVEFLCAYTTGAAAPASPFTLLTTPTGFGPFSSTVYYGILTPYGSTASLPLVPSGTANLLVHNAAANSTGSRWRSTWTTTDPWPSALPGVAA